LPFNKLKRVWRVRTLDPNSQNRVLVILGQTLSRRPCLSDWPLSQIARYTMRVGRGAADHGEVKVDAMGRGGQFEKAQLW